MWKWLIGKRRSNGSSSSEETLIQMIELRRRKDRVLRKLPHPSRVPVFQLWQTPEHLVYSTVRKYRLLQFDGLSADAAIRQIDSKLGLNLIGQTESVSSIEDYITRLLRVYHSEYLNFGASLLSAATRIAIQNLQAEVARDKSGFPPNEWLRSEISAAEFEGQFANRLSPQIFYFRRLVSRMNFPISS